MARQTAILEKLAEQKTAAAPAAAAAPVSGEDLFPDVPENHWAYDFVVKAGALKDCRVEDPANNPMLTRNDFAQILYTALKNGARECKIVCVNRYCMNLLYAPYWGKQR